MVNTRSQVRSSIPVFMSGMDKHDRSSDTESECSVPEVLSRDQIDELDDGNLIRTDNNSEQRSIDQRFSDMNKQISDLTGLVLALIEKLSSNIGEGNSQCTASDKACARSDRRLSSWLMRVGSHTTKPLFTGLLSEAVCTCTNSHLPLVIHSFTQKSFNHSLKLNTSRKNWPFSTASNLII